MVPLLDFQYIACFYIHAWKRPASSKSKRIKEYNFLSVVFYKENFLRDLWVVAAKSLFSQAIITPNYRLVLLIKKECNKKVVCEERRYQLKQFWLSILIHSVSNFDILFHFVTTFWFLQYQLCIFRLLTSLWNGTLSSLKIGLSQLMFFNFLLNI